MDGQFKRKRSKNYDLSSSNDQDDLTRTNQTLPVADLPAGFDGIPLDGAQYLAIVRHESSTVPAVSFAVNPYAKPETNGQRRSSESLSWAKDVSDMALMPSLEWRKSFLSRFSNMRTTLATQRVLQDTRDTNLLIPKGRNGKKWYRFLHGRDMQLEVKYDDEVEDCVLVESATEESAAVEPSEALLHQFASPHIIVLLSLIPYWLTQPHIDPEASETKVIDPFHARWIFSLLAHLDEQLVGDDISILRTLARACIACIIKSRVERRMSEQSDNQLQDEMGAWMIICLVAGIWGQHDIWDDCHRDLLQLAR